MKADIKKIIEIRKAKGISVNRFAEHLGVSTRTVYNWENGKSNPGKTDLMAIAHLLDVKLSDISDYKDTKFHYFKPGLHKTNNLKESTDLFKNIISNIHYTEYSKLEPLLHAYEDVCRLNKENSKLRKRVSRLNLILDSVDSAVYIKNSKHIVTYVNQGFINMLPERITEADIIGHKFSEIFPMSEIKPILNLENEAFSGMPVHNRSIKFPFYTQNQTCVISMSICYGKNSVNEIIVIYH
ncbi:MAG TPA: helix-turn-helix domain-containing protein [Victivallales bacterium]|nr:helix-turn-helix domain-containing protein [Victivallales bacterium]